MTARLRATVLIAALVCALASASAASTKRALLVGIDAYPFVKDGPAQLHGAAQDLKQMRAVLEYCGFGVQDLRGDAATKAHIEEALAKLTSGTEKGDQALFYYSGRGSLAVTSGHREDAEPTLVPYDGLPGSPANDLSIAVLEHWASAVAGRAATPIVMLDTCFQRLGTRGEDRFYKNVPRCVSRDGNARKQLYGGPGVFLSAADSRGCAYEWRVDFDRDVWAGAFTDEFTNLAMGRLRRGARPTYADLVEEVRRMFAARPGYMPGLVPQPPSADMSALYRQPAFGADAAPATPPPAAAATVAAVSDANARKSRVLRVGLDAPSSVTGDQRTQLLQGAGNAISAYLAAHAPSVEIVPPYGDRPDRVIILQSTAAGIRAEVQGNLVDAFRKPVYEGADVLAVMGAGLCDYLERQACALRLFRLADSGTTGSLPGWKIAPVKTRFRPGDAFEFTVDAPSEGSLYLLEQDDATGLVELVWPAPQDPDNAIHAGTIRLPHTTFEITPGSPEGRSLVRALVVVPHEGVKFPSLMPSGATPWVSSDGRVDPAYAGAELAHLRAVVQAATTGKADWTVIPFTYEVGP